MGLLTNKLTWIYRAIDLLENMHVVSKKKIHMDLYKIPQCVKWFIATLFVLTQMAHNLDM